eukprot:m.67837 g.67837  ORF g.67837 m.67837 type:complete len:236 (+) comp14088_c0_seq3:46-753(+)
MNDSKAFMEHGCQHYERHCRLKAKCCQRFLSCRRCHDDNPLPKCVREMDRKAVQYIQCCECGLEQLITEACRRCSQRFGRYFCPLCRHFDDDLSKKQFHCHGCGICRVGPREKYQHCDKCCVCYGRQTFENHKCVEDAMGKACIKTVVVGVDCPTIKMAKLHQGLTVFLWDGIAPFVWSFYTPPPSRCTCLLAAIFSIQNAFKASYNTVHAVPYAINLTSHQLKNPCKCLIERLL